MAKSKTTHVYAVSTLDEVAEICGVSRQTVWNWRQKSPAMPGAEGKWDVLAINRWRFTSIEQPTLSDEQKQADIRLKTAQAEAKEIENQLIRGSLVDLGDVERWAGTALAELHETILAIPDAISASAPPEVRVFAAEEALRVCSDALVMFQRRLEDNIVDGDGEVDVE